jgi:hypothetical protein
MAIYTVLAPGVPGGDAAPDPMAVVFVKEGFSWPALLFAGPWLIFRRMWLVLVGYVVVALAISAVGNAIGPSAASAAILLLHFLFALEANELRRWTLLRNSYRLIGVVEGRGLEEAEIRYFAADGAPSIRSTPAPPRPPASPARLALGTIQPSAEAGDVVGLFPSPGAV